MLGRKKIFKVSIYPEPYEIMVEAIDRNDAKEKAFEILGIGNMDICKITATTQSEILLRSANCTVQRIAYQRLIDKGYIK